MIQSTKITTPSSLISARLVTCTAGLALAGAALLLSGCGETPKMGSGSAGSAPASTPAPMDAASAPKQ